MNFCIKDELKFTILKSKNLKDTYIKKHSNSKHSIDDIIGEILYFLKSGVSWRMLRSKIPYKTLYWHYSLWVKNNVFRKLFHKIKNKYIKKYITDNCTLLVDSTTINNKNGINKVARNKFYKNKKITKVSLLSDSNGFPLSIFFMKGNYHDNSVFLKHIKDATIMLPKKNLKVMADKAYSSKENYDFLENNNIKHIIPPRNNMKIAKTYTYDKKEYIKRIKIEHIFGRLKMFRRINDRQDKLLRNFSGFCFLAFSIIGANIFNK